MKFIVSIIIAFCCLSIGTAFGQVAPTLSGMNCNFNNPSYERSILSGEQLCFTICSKGATETQNTYLKLEELPTEAAFSIINKGDINEYGRICFDINTSPQQVVDTYRVVLRAYNTSDFSGDFTEKIYTVFIQQLLEIDFEVSNTKCGEISVKAWRKNKVGIEQWIFNIGNKTEIVKGVDTATILFRNITSESVNVRVSAISANGYYPTKVVTYPVALASPFWIKNYDLFQCPNGTAKVDITDFSASNATYKWIDFLHHDANKTFERKNNTIYKIAGQNGSCSDTLTINYKVLNLSQGFSKSIKSGTAPAQVEITLTNQTDADLFIINFDNGESKTLQASAFPLLKTFNEPDTYNISVHSYKKGINACADTFNFNPINIYPTSLDETNPFFSIYPNPVGNFLIIHTEMNVERISIYTLNGKEIKIIDDLRANAVDVSNLKKGMYFLKLQSASANYTNAFIKE